VNCSIIPVEPVTLSTPHQEHPFGPMYMTHRLELRTLQDYINLYGNRAVRFEPGSRFEYSGYGHILLGRVIEKVSGESYYNYVEEHVFKPAGMTSSGSEPEGRIAYLSIGYTRFGGSAWHPNTDLLPYRGDSSGGGYSTVGDLLAFANALRDHKLLDAHYTELLTTARVDMPQDGRYAYGFIVHPLNGSECIGNAGDFPGANGDLELCLDSHYVFAVLANTDPPVAQQTGFLLATGSLCHTRHRKVYTMRSFSLDSASALRRTGQCAQRDSTGLPFLSFVLRTTRL